METNGNRPSHHSRTRSLALTLTPARGPAFAAAGDGLDGAAAPTTGQGALELDELDETADGAAMSIGGIVAWDDTDAPAAPLDDAADSECTEGSAKCACPESEDCTWPGGSTSPEGGINDEGGDSTSPEGTGGASAV